MKKPATWIAIVVVLLALYFGGTWLTGNMAHAQSVRFTEFMTRESQGMLKVVEHKSTPGFFSSNEDITFEFTYAPIATLLGTKAPQFTVHNLVQHGPLPGFRTVGIARVESTLELSEDIRKKLIEVLGTDKPVELAVTFGWFGSTTLDITSPKIEVKFPKEEGTLLWKGMKFRTVYSRDFKSFSTNAEIPGLVVDGKDGTHVVMDNLSIMGKMKASAFESLYVGDAMVMLDSLEAKSKSPAQAVTLKKVGYGISLSGDDQYYNVGLKVGAGQSDMKPVAFKEMHFDFSLNHLHGPTVSAMYKEFQEFAKKLNSGAGALPGTAAPGETGERSANELPTISEMQKDSDAPKSETPTDAPPPPPVMPDLSKVQSYASTIFLHSPELSLDHLGFATDKGELKVTGKIKLLGITESDLKTFDVNALTRKLKLAADFHITQGLIDNWPVPTQQDFKGQVKQLEQQGFLKRSGDSLDTHLEFVDGKLLANGKQVM